MGYIEFVKPNHCVICACMKPVRSDRSEKITGIQYTKH